MPDEQGFLTAIREAPDDDTPRLVYADWLDDHGDADRPSSSASPAAGPGCRSSICPVPSCWPARRNC
jgi:uncharacterized protein (TIGR02996 family)